MELLQFYEAANSQKGGGSYARYVINATRDFTKQFDEEEAKLVLQQGSQLPNAALGALYRLPEKLDPQTLTMLQELDERIAGKTGDSIQRLQVGIVAVLARSGLEPSSSSRTRRRRGARQRTAVRVRNPRARSRGPRRGAVDG